MRRASAISYLLLLILLGIGVALYGVGTILVRGAGPQRSAVTWVQSIIESPEPLDASTRIDIIERLALIGEPWCNEILIKAGSQDCDAAVRAVAVRAAASAARSRGSTSP